MSLELAVVLITFFVFMFIGMPLFFGMSVSAMLYFLLKGTSLYTLAHMMFSGLNSFVLLAIPLFVLVGEIMTAGKVTDKIARFAEVTVGRFRGGLAYANCLDSMLFGGCSGSALADVSGLGAITIPLMIKAGYDPGFSAALTAATSVQGPIIPPSLPMVLYAAAVGTVSVGGLLLGGAIPGIIIGLSDMLVVFVWSKLKSGYFPAPTRISAKETLVSIVQTLPALFTPIIIIGGIVSGIFTPTEAAAVAAAYAILISLPTLTRMMITEIFSLFKSVARKTSAMLLLTAASTAFGWVLAVEKVPVFLEGVIRGITTNPQGVLLIIAGILLIWGLFMDMTPAILLLAPIFAPIAERVGINPIHFGVVMVVALVIGLITPPYGGCLFMTTIISGIPMEKMVRSILPFIIINITVIILMIFISDIVMFLPKLFGIG